MAQLRHFFLEAFLALPLPGHPTPTPSAPTEHHHTVTLLLVIMTNPGGQAGTSTAHCKGYQAWPWRVHRTGLLGDEWLLGALWAGSSGILLDAR